MKRLILCLGFLVLAGLTWSVAAPPAGADEVTAPIKLFNGKDLTNFYTWLGAPQKSGKQLGKNNDPLKVFTVSNGMIRVSGEVYGCFTTAKEYGNYHLVAEFKWGDIAFPPREKASRDSGILVHCQGDDGSFGVWMPSIECQMIEGGTGDFLVLSNKQHKFSLTVEAEKRGGQYYYKPGASPVTLPSGRFNWWGRDPAWKDVLGFRGKEDVEHPAGQWNTLECICAGDKITNILNGKVVNVGTKCSHTKGKILFQSEGAELFFRRIELLPVKK